MKNLELDYKTILYNLVFCVFWSTLFLTNYDMNKLFYYLDVISYLDIASGGFYNAILCVFIFYYFIKYSFRTFLSIRNHFYVNNLIDFFLNGFVFAFEGVQDTGKSFCTIFLAYMVSRVKWQKLCSDHMYFMNMKDELKHRAKGNYLANITYNIFVSREQAYQFYKSNIDIYIPCLISNNVVFEKKTKRRSYSFNLDLLKIIKRVPESCVFILDEVAEDLPNTMRLVDTEKTKNKSLEQIQSEKEYRAINTFLSMARQFADSVIFINDQRLMEVFNGVRTVCQSTRSLKCKQDILKPNILLKAHNFFMSKIHKESGQAKLYKLCERLDKLYKSMGFLKITYVEKYGFDDTFKNDKQETFMYLPQNINITYHHRGRFNEYTVKKDKIDIIDKKQLKMS